MNTLTRPSQAMPTLRINLQAVILFYIFLVLPLFDMLNGFLIGQDYLSAGTLASPSQIGRFIGIVLLFIFCKDMRFSPYLTIAFLSLFILEAALFFRHNSAVGLAVGFATIIRLLYMYLLFMAFKSIAEKDFISMARFIKYNIVFICLSVIMASFTGLANSTYGWGAGTKGFFSSGNGLGIYIGVATLVLAALKRYRIYTDISAIVFGLSAGTLILLGTKTSFLMFLLVMFAGFWSGKFRLLIVPAVIFTAVRFYAEISEKLAERFDIIILRYQNSPSMIDYMLSGRNVYVENAWAEFLAQDPGLLRWLFGGGAFLSFQNPLFVRAFDILESDIFDVFFMYGLVGLFCYLAIFAASVRPFLKSFWMLLPVILLWSHSAVAGHVFFNGLGGTLIVIILVIAGKFDAYRSREGRMRGRDRRGRVRFAQ